MKFKNDLIYSNILVRGHSLFSFIFAILKQKEFKQVLFVDDEDLHDHAFHRNILGDIDFRALKELGKKFDISPLIHLDQYIFDYSMTISLLKKQLYLGNGKQKNNNELLRKAVDIESTKDGPIFATLQVAFYGNIDISSSRSRLEHLSQLYTDQFYFFDYDRLLSDLIFYLTRLGATVIKSKINKISSEGGKAWAIELSNFYGVCNPVMSYFFDEDRRELSEEIKRYQSLIFNVELPPQTFHRSIDAHWQLSPLHIQDESFLFAGYLIKKIRSEERSGNGHQMELFTPFELGAKSSFYLSDARSYLNESIAKVAGLYPERLSTPYLKRGDAFTVIKGDELVNANKLTKYVDETGVSYDNVQTISPYFFGGRSYQSVVQAILSLF